MSTVVSSFSRLIPFQINQAALKLSRILATARQFENSFLPINRLPPGIIALTQTFRGSELDLVNATAVCAYWRESLVSTPNLWNNIVCSKDATLDSVTPRVHAYFKRSGSIPINVQINAHFSRLISPHAGRISQLTMFIDAGTPSGCDEIVKHLSKSAPLLEAITIEDIHERLENLELPLHFSEEFISSVRTLTLCRALPSPGQYKFSRLARFTLRVYITEGTWPAILDTLEQMPLLQILVAELDIQYPLDPLPEDRVVMLQHLEEITIKLYNYRYWGVTGLILPAFCLPRARKVIMDLSSFTGFYRAAILPLSELEERLPCLSVTPSASISLRKGIRNTLNFLGPGQSALTLLLHSATINSLTSKSMPSGIPFDSVRKLCISFENPGDYGDLFIRLLRCMKGLECLEMRRNTVTPISLWANVDGQAKICPALTALTVIDDSFAEVEKWVEQLEWLREHAGVPIASVEKRYN